MTRFARAKEEIIADLGNIVPELFVKFRQAHSGYHVNSPGHARPACDQMKIWPDGGWKDFVAGEQGDAIDLIAYVEFGGVDAETRKMAVEWAESRFGLKTLDPATARRRADERQARQQRAEEEQQKRSHDNRNRARRMFYAAHDKISGTPADTYLRGRGIELEHVKHLCCPSFRYLELATFWTAPRRPQFPALVSKLVDHQGHGRAVHLTFLEPHGRRKLDTEMRGLLDADGKPLKTKLMWPETKGLVIRVADGETGLSAELAAEQKKPGLVAITEGVEDALSIAMVQPEWRVWAAASLPNLLHLPDHPAVSAFMIFRDNDWDKPQAVALFDRAMRRLQSFGKPIETVSMPTQWGKDLNDAINFLEE